MKFAGRTASIIAMILSALLFVVMLAGIGGAWWLRGEGMRVVTSVAALGDRALVRGQELAFEAERLVGVGQGAVERVTTGIARAGATIEETNLLLAATERLLDRDLTPEVKQVAAIAQTSRDTLAVVDQTISLWRVLAGQPETRLVDGIDSLVSRLAALDESVIATRQALQQTKSDKVSTVVTTLTEPLNRANVALTNVSTGVAQVQQRLVDQRVQLIVLRDRMNRAITWATVAMTLLLLWMALSQASVFLHGFGLLTGRDPLARWHRREREAPPQAELPSAAA